jgi:hypothetical protein
VPLPKDDVPDPNDPEFELVLFPRIPSIWLTRDPTSPELEEGGVEVFEKEGSFISEVNVLIRSSCCKIRLWMWETGAELFFFKCFLWLINFEWETEIKISNEIKQYFETLSWTFKCILLS